MKPNEERTLELIRRSAQPMRGTNADYDSLVEAIGERRFVLIGEASHGTHDFYHHRAEITKRLIVEKGFNAVAVEADWPDAYTVNRYVRGTSDGGQGDEALSGFTRFPSWMWRNRVVLEFVEWLKSHDTAQADDRSRAGFYGIDLYSLTSSVAEVIAYLERVDPEAARRARERYACFDHFGEDAQAYGYASTFDISRSCEEDVIRQLMELMRSSAQYVERDGQIAADEYFYAVQNARLVMNAEQYYRSMFLGRVSSWNLRDTHMTDTLDALAEHLQRQHGTARLVVWAHNSHLGDARSTSLGAGGEVNVGQLVRQRHGADVYSIGFTTYDGTVSAASDWDEPVQLMTVRPGLPGSYEELFHSTGIDRFVLHPHAEPELQQALNVERLERAIGVIYRPRTERLSHYFGACLAGQFDAVIHLDRTTALEPLDAASTPGTEAPETYPSGV